MKTNTIKSLFLILLLSSLFSCHKKSNLEQALEFAGENRVELEKVLTHYSQNTDDSLKYRAAVFLIENMPWHYSYGGEYIESYVRRIDSCFVSLPVELRLALYCVPEKFHELHKLIEIKPDAQNITAEYLIQNIDRSFEMWQKSSWLKDLYFENFCEYLLPYRIGREPLSFWKDSLSVKFRDKIRDGTENLHDFSKDAYYLYKFLDYHLMRDEEYCFREFSIPDSIIGNYTLDCVMSSTAYAFLWRMCGIPTAVDVLPRHGNSNPRHSDITIIDERMRGEVHKEQYHYPAKVYRNTYSVNRSQILSPTKDFVPTVANNPFYKDVTASYTRTSDITIKVNTGKNKPEHLYLGVFSLGWDAIAHAPIKHGKAIFKDVGVGVVYIPFYYKDDKQIFVSDPFYLDAKKQLYYFNANKNNTQTVILDRKYPIGDYKIWWSQLFLNGKFEAAKDAQFSNPQHIFTINENTYWRKISVKIDSSIKARYYRFIDYGWPVDLAEIHFYDTNGKEITGKWIGDSITLKNPDLPNIYDNNILSFALIESWVGIDFGEEVTLSRIEYIPRNDANGIYPGMNYELFYFDKDKWSSLGVKKATDYTINYKEVPRNTLLWLRNLTEGKEERIFKYENDKQVWY